MSCHVSRSTGHASRFALLAVLLLAAFLRFYRLDVQSLWNDEGNSARIAERSVGLIVEGAAGDIHPPGYYLLLHYWRALFGQSEFALRALSAVAGLASAALTYSLGRDLFGKATGLIAAFLVAISPFAVYYSQEARMYALLTALSAVSALLTIHLLQSAGTQHPTRNVASDVLAAYVAANAAGLYTHYVFAFVLIAHNVVFGLWWLVEGVRSRQHWRFVASWAGAQVAVVVLYLPWLPIALRGATGWSPASGSYELGPALLDVLRILTVGITQPLEKAGAALIVAGLLLVAGLWPRKVSLWSNVATIGLYLLLPIALFFAFDLYKPAWLKFLVVALPPFCTLIAHGMNNLANLASHVLRSTQYATRGACSTLRAGMLALLIVVTLPSLHNLYFDPVYARDDYRQIAADVRAIGRTGDAIVLNAPNQWEVFTYYYPDRDVYPAPYHPSPGEVERFLTPILEEHERLFVLYWGDAESDPKRLIESWLATHAYKANDRWYGDVHLAMYGTASESENPDLKLDAHFGESIRLHGYALERVTSKPGNIVPVTLFWEAKAPVAEPYKVTVQMLDDRGRLVAQVDTEPRDGLAPTTSWEAGQVLTDRYGVYLPPDAPIGRHMLIVALYHAFNGERLPVSLGDEPMSDHLPLGEIVIES